MATLIVRGIEDSIVTALKRRAVRHRRSAEAEHRAILAESLQVPRKRSLAEVLAGIPAVGRDEDFARVEDRAVAADVPR